MVAQLATSDQLRAFVGPDSDVRSDAEHDRLLSRASELLASTAIRARFSVGDDGLPTDSTIADTLADACCAQVEYWLDIGEDFAIEGLVGAMSALSSSVQAPASLAPRAYHILHASGLTQPWDIGAPNIGAVSEAS